jgi:hypothetical protein
LEVTNKEIAKRLRYIAENGLTDSFLFTIANELDPPNPEPWTVVWIRWRREAYAEWKLAQVNEVSGVDLFGTIGEFPLEELEWKPARILADDEVAVKVPPVSEWPEDAWVIEAAYTIKGGGARFFAEIIHRTEAEAREVGDEG